MLYARNQTSKFKHWSRPSLTPILLYFVLCWPWDAFQIAATFMDFFKMRIRIKTFYIQVIKHNKQSCSSNMIIELHRLQSSFKN